MKPRLQRFDHKSSAYERPHQPWICGRSFNGEPCPLGPDIKGHCRTLSVCRPRRTPEGWVCMRTDSAGGPCSQGPSSDGRCCKSLKPCAPVRSVRNRRGRAAMLASVLSVGALILFFGSRMNADFIEPGEVHAGHAEVQNCEDCHTAFEGGPANWLKVAFSPSDPVADSKKCLACHTKGEEALLAHNVEQLEIGLLSQKFIDREDQASPTPWSVSISRVAFPLPSEADRGPLACTACHKEHEGEDADLLSVSNARCQSCHEETFQTFSNGHPSFGDYPYLRRTRIIFDHESHNRKNFAEMTKQGIKAPETCDSCHVPDATGQVMITKSFEETCAACHAEDVSGEQIAGPKGTPLIAVPELDLDTLVERGVAIGEWPYVALATEVSPYTKLLIAGDAIVARDLAIVDDLDLQDLSQSTDEELAAVGRVAWAIKEVLFDLAIEGMGVLQARVEASLDSALDTDTVGRLVGHVPQDVITAAGQSWFPDLKREVIAYRELKSASVGDGVSGRSASDDLSANVILAQAGDVAVDRSDIETKVQEDPIDPAAENEALGLPSLDAEDWAMAGGWYRKDYTLYYRPVEHEDVFLRTWHDISSHAFGTPAESYGQSLLELLSDKNTPGKCTKCHSVDQQLGGGLDVQWAPFQPMLGEQHFTMFDHEPHFSAIDEDGCVTCHKLNEDTAYQQTYEAHDPLQFVANFAPIQRDTCTDCHVEDSAGDSCVMCHQYHVGEFGLGSMPTRMDDLDKVAPPATPGTEAEGAPAEESESFSQLPGSIAPAPSADVDASAQGASLETEGQPVPVTALIDEEPGFFGEVLQLVKTTFSPAQETAAPAEPLSTPPDRALQ